MTHLRSRPLAAAAVAAFIVILVVTLWPREVAHQVASVDPQLGSADSSEEPSVTLEIETSDDPPTAVGESGVGAGARASVEEFSPFLAFGGELREISSVADWERALANARPGDELRLVSNIGSVLLYDGDDGAPSGTASSPIVITADPDIWIDPGNPNNQKPALDIRSVRHVWVHDVRVRGSQFGIRFLGAGGSDETPARIQNSVVTDIGDACVHIGAVPDVWQVSSHVIVESNDISGCGSENPRFGEGVYIGYGKTQWIDETHDITVRGNEIYELGSEALDIKTGSRNIIVEDNLIRDVGGINGGVISAHYAVDPNPKPGELDSIVIRRNRIWNVNLDNRPESNDWAIWVGHGGVQVLENRIWNLRDVSSARAIRVRAEADFGDHPITIEDNVLWARVGWEATGNPSGSDLIDASGNVGPAGSSGVEETFAPDVSVEGDARSSAGATPGSIFDRS